MTTRTNYTISKMFYAETQWVAYEAGDAQKALNYCIQNGALQSHKEHYLGCAQAMYAQHEILEDGTVAFPARVVLRLLFDKQNHRLIEKKNPDPAFKAIIDILLNNIVKRLTGEEILERRKARLAAKASHDA